MKEKNGARHSKFWLVPIGLAIGFINGFFGGGGGMLCVPALSLVLGLATKQSHATALAVMLPLTVVSAVVYLLSGSVELGVLLPVGGGFVAGGALGALALSKLKNGAIAVGFACVMIFAGVSVLL
jgi:uncharacterized membrane protein YfcA